MSRRGWTLAAVLATALAPRLALADDTGDLEALLDEPVVATASKTPEVVSLAPAMTTVITADDLRRYGIRSLDEAIAFLAVGMESQTPLSAAEVGARGVLITQDYGNHVLLLIDGHAVNEPWGGTAYFERGAGIPLEIVDHIEVILGPGSVLYGSNAMLGVIHVVTKRARDFEGLHAIAESEVLPTPEGVGVSGRGAAGAGFVFDVDGTPSELTFIAEYYQLNGPPFAFGPQDYGADAVTGEPRVFSDQLAPGVWGGVASQAYHVRVPSAYARLVIGELQIKARGSIFERAYPYHLGDFDDPGNEEIDRFLSLDASLRTPIHARADMLFRVYGDLYDYRQIYPSSAAEDCLPGQDAGCIYTLDGFARWVGVETALQLDWFGDARYGTLVGFDARVKNVGSVIAIADIETEDSPPLPGDVEVTELAVGIYGQQTLRPVKWLGINAGVRLDLDERYGAHASPRGAVVVSAWEGAAFKAVYAEAFRAPTAFERYYADPTSQVEAPDLQSEVVRSVEVSFEQRFGTQRLEFGGFASFWDDLVLTEDLTQAELDAAIARGELLDDVTFAQQTRNGGTIEAIGFTARYDGSADDGRLRYGASFTQARARRDDPVTAAPVKLAAAAQTFGNARISYDLSGGWPVVGLAGRFAGPRPSNGADIDGVVEEAPAQGEVRTTVSGPFPKVTGLSYRLSGSWAFHEHYPYTVGPAYLADGSAELAPVEPIKIAFGLQYDLSL